MQTFIATKAEAIPRAKTFNYYTYATRDKTEVVCEWYTITMGH